MTNPPTGSRPFLLLTTDRVAFVRSKTNVNDLAWQKFTNQLALHQGTGVYAPYGWVAADALAFRLTGDTNYLNDAKTKYNEYYATWDYQDGSGLTYQWTCRYLCWAYDWLYNDLTPAERDTWRQKIKDAALYWQPLCYPKSYNSGLSYRDTDHVSFLMENMLYSGLCLYGDDTNADLLVNTSDDILNSVIIPNLFANFYDGGYIWSGTMYGPEEVKHAYRSMIVNRGARGISLPGNFHDGMLRSMLYQTFPGYEGTVEYGDMHLGNYQPAGWSSEAYPPYAAFEIVATLQWLSSNAVLRNHAQYWINRYESMIDRDSLLNLGPWAIESLLFQNLHNAAATNPAATGETLVNYVPGGFVSMRSSWDDNATAIYFNNSEWNVDHQHMDCGHYTIVRNKRPVTSDLSGYWGGGYPACQDTLAHNAILIENAQENDGQTGVTLDNQAGVTQTSVDYDDQFGYIRGEYAHAYNYTGWNGTDMTGKYVVSNALRKIFWIRPDLVILHDYIRLMTNQPARYKKLIHHFQGAPANDGAAITCLSESNKTFFLPLLPAGATITTTREDTVFLNYAQDGIMDGQKNYYITIDAGNGQNTQVFLNVMYLVDSNSPATMPPTTTFASSNGTFTGTQITMPGTGYVWLCRNGPTRTNRTDYSADANTNLLQHFITDLSTAATFFAKATPAGAKLDVTVRPTNFTGATVVKSSIQGTLKFATWPDGTVAAQDPAFSSNTVTLTSGSLQAAIDATPTGGTLKVAANTFNENVHIDKAMTLLGGYAPSGDWSSRNPTQFVVTVQGANTSAVFTLNDTLNLKIDGLRITGGARGIEMIQNIYPNIIFNVMISSNVIEQNGKASGDPYFFGGALYLRGSNVSVVGNIIRSNSAGKGGGIAMNTASNWLIQGNTLEYNWVYSDHGASMYVSSAGRIIGNVFRYNTSGVVAGYGWGGAFTTDHMTGEIASNSIYGNYVQSSGNVHIDEASSVTFHHNLVVSNRSGSSAAGLRIGREGGSGPGSFVDMSYCTIANNTSPGDQNAVNLDASDITIKNSIVWGNGANPIGTDNTGISTMTWSICDQVYAGTGNLTNNPLFANASAGDYHVKSTAGRWNPSTGTWITDTTNSPAIDGGDPTSPFGNEPGPNGSTANLGAYGNTAEASKSTDTDGDGLSDTLEIYRNRSSPAAAHSDGDGANDWEEYVAGTSATNSADVLSAQTMVVTNGTEITWAGKAGRRYRLYGSTDLLAGTWWDTAVVVTGQNVQVTMIDTNASRTSCFYSISAQWP